METAPKKPSNLEEYFEEVWEKERPKSLADMLKELYSDAYMQDIIYEDNPFLKAIKSIKNDEK